MEALRRDAATGDPCRRRPGSLRTVERLGLVGLPNSGKSSLFNALTGASTVVAPHPFSTTETSVALAQVPDERVDRLGKMSNSKKLVYTGFEIVDIAALVKGASTGEGLGNRFLGSLRDCDAILYVLRAFEDPSVPGDTDPRADLDTLELELVLADLASVEGRLYRQQRAAKGDKSLAAEIAALEHAARVLGDGVPLYRSEVTGDERELLAPAFLLTTKPVLAVVNIGRGPARPGRRAGGGGRRRRRGDGRVPATRGGGRAARTRRARRAARRPRARRGRRAARRPRRVSPARPAHVPHHG